MNIIIFYLYESSESHPRFYSSRQKPFTEKCRENDYIRQAQRTLKEQNRYDLFETSCSDKQLETNSIHV